MTKKLLTEEEHLKFQLGVAQWQIFSGSMTAMGAVFLSVGVAFVLAFGPTSFGTPDEWLFSAMYATMMTGGLTAITSGFLLPFLRFKKTIAALGD